MWVCGTDIDLYNATQHDARTRLILKKIRYKHLDLTKTYVGCLVQI